MRARTAASVAAALMLVSCRPAGPPPAIDPRLARAVPGDASAIAGFKPEALRGLAGGFAADRYVVIAVRGSEVLTLTLSPAGAAGARTAPGAMSPLLSEAEPLAAHYPAWAVIRGGTTLPLEGNLANFNRLFRDTELVTIAAQFGDRVALELNARCSTPQDASRFEGSLRAILLLTRLAPSTQVQRDDRKVHASLVASPESVSSLLH